MTQEHLILLLLLGNFCETQSKKREISYNVIVEGHWILGKKGDELTAKSSQECSLRCLDSDKCSGYKYQHRSSRPGNCLLIYCADAQRFESDQNGTTYKKMFHVQSNGIWIPPVCWTGPEAAFYCSFDNNDGLIFREGHKRKTSFPLISGKVNAAFTLNRQRRQWVDLGYHNEACMTRPETCGAAGGAISMWVKCLDCNWYRTISGIISSHPYRSSGSLLYSSTGKIRSFIILPDGNFHAAHNIPSGWFHAVLNYVGPNNGQGISMFCDGAEVASDSMKSTGHSFVGNGRIAMGVYYTNSLGYHASMQVDELVFFNQTLSTEDISALYTET